MTDVFRIINIDTMEIMDFLEKDFSSARDKVNKMFKLIGEHKKRGVFYVRSINF